MWTIQVILQNIVNEKRKCMMKLKKHIVMIILMGIIVGCSSAPFTISAAQPNSDAVVSETTNVATTAAFYPCYFGSDNDEYSSRVWGSLAAAQAYYGYDYIYSSCNVTYNGRYYNYCYAFSESGHCFFRVAR